MKKPRQVGIDDVLISDHQKGKFNFLDLAKTLEAILIYHENHDDPALGVRGRATRRRQPGGFHVPVRIEIIEIAIEAALIAAGVIKRPSHRPTLARIVEARRRGMAEKELLRPGFKREAAIAKFKEHGVGRTTALKYLRDGRKHIEDFRRQKKNQKSP